MEQPLSHHHLPPPKPLTLSAIVTRGRTQLPAGVSGAHPVAEPHARWQSPRGAACVTVPQCHAHPPQCISTRRKGERCQTSHSSAVGTRNRPREKQIIPQTSSPGLYVCSQCQIVPALTRMGAVGLRCMLRSEGALLAEDLLLLRFPLRTLQERAKSILSEEAPSHLSPTACKQPETSSSV